MQVLGDLIKLPKHANALPVPWWQRAPLGFLDGTIVHVGLVRSARPVGDLVISALDITKWNNTLRLDCTHDDERGVIAKLMQAVFPLNVALAETVTTETGKEHHATLICEDKGMLMVKDSIPKIKQLLTKWGFRKISIDPFLSPSQLPVLRNRSAIVRNGWIRNIDFETWMHQQYDASKLALVDLDRAVVSADTENRILRYVFPYKNSKTIKIPHSDRPGALRSIFEEFASCNLNVLSALLRRGGQKSGYAELLAVCEPNHEENSIQVYEALKQKIRSIDQQFDAQIIVQDARNAEGVVYAPRLPERRGRQIRVCVLFRGPSLDEGAQFRMDMVRKRFHEEECRIVDAGPNFADIIPNLMSASSVMDTSDAVAIVLTGFQSNETRDFEQEVICDLGYLRSIDKSVIILAEENARDRVHKWLRHDRHVVKALNLESHAQVIQSWLSETRDYLQLH
jgi:hypothetical protein